MGKLPQGEKQDRIVAAMKLRRKCKSAGCSRWEQAILAGQKLRGELKLSMVEIRKANWEGQH
jgi:hypothetical protein